MKITEVNDMSLDELKEKEMELSEKLFLFRSQKRLGKLEKVIQLRFLRRDIAKIKTVLTMKYGNKKS